VHMTGPDFCFYQVGPVTSLGPLMPLEHLTSLGPLTSLRPVAGGPVAGTSYLTLGPIASHVTSLFLFIHRIKAMDEEGQCVVIRRFINAIYKAISIFSQVNLKAR
jgi:hypothetical protein